MRTFRNWHKIVKNGWFSAKIHHKSGHEGKFRQLEEGTFREPSGRPPSIDNTCIPLSLGQTYSKLWNLPWWKSLSSYLILITKMNLNIRSKKCYQTIRREDDDVYYIFLQNFTSSLILQIAHCRKQNKNDDNQSYLMIQSIALGDYSTLQQI